MPDYPGLGLPLRHNRQEDYEHYPIGAHGSCRGADSDMLPVREVAMMSIMDRLTDKEGWHKKVFDDAIVSKWREEALAIPDEHFWRLATGGKLLLWDDEGELADFSGANHVKPLKGIMSTTSFDCCIQELRSKARHYEESGLIPTLDACASVVKADNLVSVDLHKSLCAAFETLKEEQSSAPDWHPNSNDLVQDLVHPSMYPLVYGRSGVLKDEVVGVVDAIKKWAGKGDIIPKDSWTYNAQRDRFRYGVGASEVPPEYWSDTYQWLPSNVAFQDDGSVRFTSYINNLHPEKFPQVYRAIEKLIETALPAWDQCLVATDAGYGKGDGAGRVKSRFPYPDNPDDENPENWSPSDAEEVANIDVNWDEVDSIYHYDPKYDDETEKKWKLLRDPVVLEPVFEDVKYAASPSKRLAQKFRESGLQVIVKMASIELTPEKPEFPVGGWHVEGQMNEHICGTALYYLDSENITPSNLSFRMQTSAYMNDEIEVGQDAYHWLEQVYGTELGGGCAPCLQTYGNVETRQGRLLAFPNVFQHKVSSFRLEDATKPGHRRFIALWLVDPTQRIISTANVPPQQMDWWLDSTFGVTDESRKAAIGKLPADLVTLMNDKGLIANVSASGNATLPPELMDMVRERFDDELNALPMGSEEAREHRLKLMEARSAFVKTSEAGWQQHSYSFCEH
ncbi:hypothetical protein SCAR479_06779 [Seiridium cardinale]|uniref:Uncharacterized protein n=1 Tax=Seiridium cardinale TaxID=138064 RepID=A0ABR2XS82_9PEZI